MGMDDLATGLRVWLVCGMKKELLVAYLWLVDTMEIACVETGRCGRWMMEVKLM